MAKQVNHTATATGVLMMLLFAVASASVNAQVYHVHCPLQQLISCTREKRGFASHLQMMAKFWLRVAPAYWVRCLSQQRQHSIDAAFKGDEWGTS
jgi:hypothetical protein